MPIWDFDCYGINDLLEIRKAARKLATFELGLDNEALAELDRTLCKQLKTTKRIVCPNCGEIDSVSVSSEPDEFVWDQKSASYEAVSAMPEQSILSCTKCKSENIRAVISGDTVTPEDQEDLLTEGGFDGEN
jgi:hypothetical protein